MAEPTLDLEAAIAEMNRSRERGYRSFTLPVAWRDAILAALERADRVEAAVHFLLYEAGSEAEQGVAVIELAQLVPPNLALAAARAEEGEGG